MEAPSRTVCRLGVLGWPWLGITGLVPAVARIIAKPTIFWVPAWALAGLAALFLIGVVQVNRAYGQYPTLGASLGLNRPELTELSTLEPAAETLRAPAGGHLSDVWPGLPTASTIRS